MTTTKIRTSMYFHEHPILGVILAGLLTATGFGIGGDLHLQIQPVHEVGLPLWIKDVFQCIAWSGAGITGYVAGHGYWVKYVLPKIENWKQKKSRKK